MLSKRNIIIYTSQLISVLAGVVLSVLLVRIVPKEWVGQFLYFYSVNTIVIGLLTAPLGLWLTRARKGGDDNEEIVAIMQIWTLLATLISFISILMIALGLYYYALAGIYIATGIMISSYTYEWNSNNSYFLYSLGNLLNAISRAVIIILSFFMWSASMTLEIAATVSSIFILIFMLFLSRRFSKKSLLRPLLKATRVQEIKKGWILIKSMLLSSAVFSLFHVMDKTLVKFFFGPDKVAELITTQQWSYVMVTTALGPIIAIIYPLILQDKLDVNFLVKKYISYFPFLLALIILGFFSLKEIAVNLMPVDYIQKECFLWIGMISGLIFMAGQILSVKFSKEGCEINHLISVLVPFGLIAPISFALTYKFEVIGALYSVLLFNMTYFLLCLVLSKDKK